MRRFGSFERVSRIPNGKLSAAPRIDYRAVGESRTTNRFALLTAWHGEMMVTGDLLIRAVAIERDLRRRLSKQPKNKALLKQWKEYETLVEGLVWEHKTAVANYLAAIRRFTRR